MPYKDPQKKKEWIAKNRDKVCKHKRDFNKRHDIGLTAEELARRANLAGQRATLGQRRGYYRVLSKSLQAVLHHGIQKHMSSNKVRAGHSYMSYFQDRARSINRQNSCAEEACTKEYVLGVFEQFNWRCYNCGSTTELSIDHHWSKSYCIALSDNNAVLLCEQCNSSKARKRPAQFYSVKQLNILNTKYDVREEAHSV